MRTCRGGGACPSTTGRGRPRRAPRSDAVGGDQGAVQTEERHSGGVRLVDDLMQVGRVRGDHVQPHVQIPVSGGVADARIAGEGVQVGAVAPRGPLLASHRADAGGGLPGHRSVLDTHVSQAMAAIITARPWLTVFRLPPYAPELNPVEPVRAHLKRSLTNLTKHDIAELTT